MANSGVHFYLPPSPVTPQQDLKPIEWDPRCNRQFPLGNFWPVYLGNFWCDEYFQHAKKVQEYFACKGLLVRMVFGRNAMHDPHFEYQQTNNLYDFLVYFLREQDAEDAVTHCHREMYYGHRLNVFPGRVPVIFDVKRSIKHDILQPLRVPMTEQIYETFILQRSSVQVSCVVQHCRRSLLVEFASISDRNRAILSCQICRAKKIPGLQKKQRFLEKDVESEILEWLQLNPINWHMLPPIFNLASFSVGTRFNCYSWQTQSRLRMPPRMHLIGYTGYVWKIHKQGAEAALKNFGLVCTCPRHLKTYARENKKHAQEIAAKQSAASGSAAMKN